MIEEQNEGLRRKAMIEEQNDGKILVKIETADRLETIRELARVFGKLADALDANPAVVNVEGCSFYQEKGAAEPSVMILSEGYRVSKGHTVRNSYFDRDVGGQKEVAEAMGKAGKSRKRGRAARSRKR